MPSFAIDTAAVSTAGGGTEAIAQSIASVQAGETIAGAGANVQGSNTSGAAANAGSTVALAISGMSSLISDFGKSLRTAADNYESAETTNGGGN